MFDARVVGALVALAVLVLANAGVAYHNTRKLHDGAFWVDHTNAVIDALDATLSTLMDAETGQRGYIITGEEVYLEPYEKAVDELAAKLTTLRHLTEDNQRQQARLPLLEKLIQGKMDELAETIALRQTQGFEAAQRKVLDHFGLHRMDVIRESMEEMEAEELDLLQTRRAISESAYQTSLLSIWLAASIGVIAIGGFVTLLRRQLKDRAHAAATLHAQREWFRTTLTSIGDAVIATDTEGRVTFLNSVAVELTGWKEDDAKGRPLEEVFRIVNEHSRATAPNPAARALAEGRVVGLANHTLLISRAGAELPISDSAAPIKDQAERIIGVVLVFRDVSDLKRLEDERRRQLEQLTEAEQRFRSVVNNVLDAIITIDAKGLMRSFNPAAERLFSYRPSEVMGQNVKLLMPEPYHGEHDAYIGNYLRTGQAKIIGTGREVVGRRKDGATFPLELAVSEFHLGQELYFTGIVRDITERKRTEEQTYGLLIELKEADLRKDEFLATLAHELRGPLAPLSNVLELIQPGRASAELLEQARSIMERQLAQMVRLVDDLLDVSRITRNKLMLRPETFDLAEAVEQAVETCRPLVERSRMEIAVSLPAEPIHLHGDRARLSQVLGNLLNNACKFTPADGHVRLTVERAGSEAVVVVTDDGIGISPEALPHIFDMFMQADRSLERTQSGLGIGLTLVKQLVELHGGSVEAFSDGPDRGSRFVVRLPILVAREAAPRRRSEPQRPAAVRRVLVVDDNQDAATSLALLLRIAGIETRTAHDGLQAVELAEHFRPQAVLLDIGLPLLNGYGAAQRIREQPWGRAMVLVALTGWGQDGDRRKSKEAGFDHHMVKPVDHDVLMDLLASLPGEEPV